MRIPAWFQRWASEGNDPAIRATGYTYSTDRFYDEQKASAGYRRSRWQTETGRPYARAVEDRQTVRRIK